MATQIKRASASLDKIEELLGTDARALLDHTTSTIPKDQIQLPGADFVDRVWSASDRNPSVLRAHADGRWFKIAELDGGFVRPRRAAVAGRGAG